MEEFVPLLVMLAMVKSLVDLVRRATAGDVKGAFTILLSYAVAIAVVFVVANTDFAADMAFGNFNLASLNAFSLVMVGFAVASTAGLAKDTLKAVDNNQTEAVPTLFAGTYHSPRG